MPHPASFLIHTGTRKEGESEESEESYLLDLGPGAVYREASFFVPLSICRC
jgi:hypothetical protein